jgi:outer membrane protein assembly factor BamE
MRKILITSIVLFLSACSVYKIDIQQGNVLEPKAIEKLKVGMTKQQVLFIMGDPLLKDPFHASRWDYIHMLTPGGGKTHRKLLTLYFDADSLSRIDDSQLATVTLGKIKSR